MEEVPWISEIPFRPPGEDAPIRDLLAQSHRMQLQQRPDREEEDAWSTNLAREPGSGKKHCRSNLSPSRNVAIWHPGRITPPSCSKVNNAKLLDLLNQKCIPLCRMRIPKANHTRKTKCYRILSQLWPQQIPGRFTVELKIPNKQPPRCEKTSKLEPHLSSASIQSQTDPSDHLKQRRPVILSPIQYQATQQQCKPFILTQKSTPIRHKTVTGPTTQTRLKPQTTNLPKPSILGPHPDSITKLYKQNQAPHITFFHPPAKTNLSCHTPSFNQNYQDNGMDQSDEDLIRKFADLQTNSQAEGSTVVIPSKAFTSRNWGLCLLVKIVSDRAVFDAQFEKQMRRAWGAHPSTIFTVTDRSLYLVECENRGDYTRILNDGPWSYRQDLVVIKECRSQEEVDVSRMSHAEIWIQLHNLPVHSLTEEGVQILIKDMGMMLSDPIPAAFNGKQFLRVKMLIPLTVPVKDRINYTNPTIGDSVVHVVFERIGRICCFCGIIGHQITTCADRARLAKIRTRPENANRPEMRNIMKPTRGPWITDQTLIPTSSPKPGPNTQTEQQPHNQNSEPAKRAKRPHFTSQNNLTIPLITDLSSPILTYQPEENKEEDGGDCFTTRRVKAARPSAMSEMPPSQI